MGEKSEMTAEGAAPDAKIGLAAALGAYGAWGLLGIYYASLSHVSPLEVVSHRVAWSLVVLGLVFLVSKRWGEVWAALQQPKILLTLFATSLLISVNWLTYIWAVSNGQATEASLGYFIVPLANVAMGYVLLSERLSRVQIVAIGLASLAIFLQMIVLGSLPIVALVLAFSFGGYGYLRKIVPVGPQLGLMVELVLISPFAVGFLVYLHAIGAGNLTLGDLTTTMLLMLTGLLTSVPLMWFSTAAKNLRISTLGIVQYFNPSLQFLMATLVLNEQVSLAKLATFCLIWLSVLIYCYDALWSARHRQ